MGGCQSDLEGVEGVHQRRHQSQRTMTNTNTNGAHNGAVNFFYKIEDSQPKLSQVKLSLSASNLLDRDIASKSDPMVVVYAKKRDGKLEELGRTEVIMNCLNPKWKEKIAVVFQFEVVQPLEFHVYRVNTKYHGVPTKTIVLKDQDFLGKASCTLFEIVTNNGKSLTSRLQNKIGHGGSRNLGALTIDAEESVASRRTAVEMILRCSHSDNKKVFSKTDRFLKISRAAGSRDSIPICKTEVINNLNPTWKPVSLSSHQFGSKDNPLLIECFDFNSSGNHVVVGQLWSTIADLEKHHKVRTCSNFFMSSKPHGKKAPKTQLFVDYYSEKEHFSFIDYLSSGFELNFVVAIDFTSSNGYPRSPDSLHYIDPSNRLNSYQKAIMEVGEVIQFYDSDRQFDAWGFGGIIYLGNLRTISNCFNLNGSPSSSKVVGVEGIMDAYASSLRNVSQSGPTLFAPVINKAAQMAAESLSSHNSTKYYVLLIITDGLILDLPETMDALVNASDLPLSVLIVGLGNANFKSMELLNAGNGRRSESSTGAVATRDIVHFVPMKETQSGQNSAVEAILKELPDQFLDFMQSRGIKPLD